MVRWFVWRPTTTTAIELWPPPTAEQRGVRAAMAGNKNVNTWPMCVQKMRWLVEEHVRLDMTSQRTSVGHDLTSPLSPLQSLHFEGLHISDRKPSLAEEGSSKHLDWTLTLQHSWPPPSHERMIDANMFKSSNEMTWTCPLQRYLTQRALPQTAEKPSGRQAHWRGRVDPVLQWATTW